MQPKLLFGDKDLGRAFQGLNETWEVDVAHRGEHERVFG